MTSECVWRTAGGYHRIVDMRSPFVAGLAAFTLALVGCSTRTVSAPAPSTMPAPPSPSASSASALASATPSAAPAIVGKWVGTHDCERIVTLLTDAGLDEFLADAVYGNGLAPGDPNAEVSDPTTVCEGAVERQHSHFFTADGEFGSRDFHGERVDDGTYRLEDPDVIVINRQRFKYEIDGDQLSLEPEPVDISTCTTKECRFIATWVLMVAMPGTTWTRGEITPS